jgi:hypothetical protein
LKGEVNYLSFGSISLTFSEISKPTKNNTPVYYSSFSLYNPFFIERDRSRKLIYIRPVSEIHYRIAVKNNFNTSWITASLPRLNSFFSRMTSFGLKGTEVLPKVPYEGVNSSY